MNEAEAKKIVVSVIESNVLGLEMSDEKMNQTLVDLGVDSLDVMIVIMDVAEAAGVEISDDQIDELETPQKIVDFKKIWFYHDAIDEVDKKPDLKFLEEFEKKYNIPLTALVFSERIFMEYNEFYRFSTDQILRILELDRIALLYLSSIKQNPLT